MLVIASPCNEPKWLELLEGEERARALLMFNVKLAALHASPNGTLATLAEIIGVTNPNFSHVKRRGSISPRLAIAIEKAVGRDIMPREALCPEYFQIEA